MIANLPLLFANGNPTALTKITAVELEKFITFMVTCSWGHDTAKDIKQPPWWPDDVKFVHPFTKPHIVPKDWENRLKRLVKRCYDYHKSAFLLVFSAQLARHPPHRLKYVDNLDHTTSLFHKPTGKLLVTFRNENINYDRSTDDVEAIDDDDEDVQVKSTDIYLCDTCDSHFDNLCNLEVHERLCNNQNLLTSAVCVRLPEFLDALKLKPVGAAEQCTVKEIEHKSKNGRNAANIDRGPPYPFSSLAYLRNAKSNTQWDKSYSRERVERYCCEAPTTSKGTGTKMRGPSFPVKYRRPIDYWNRKQVFPYQRGKEILDLTGQLLMLKCRPISVKVNKMSLEAMQEYIDKLKEEKERKEAEDKDIEFIEFDCDQESESDRRVADPLHKSQSDCEIIDLCSDDDTPSFNENCDPRAGITCVMQGGAVLRRTAATPNILPAEPCGARDKPMSTVLQSQPVILFTHSLHPNIQTISLD